ncbi:MAG: helix-turn-helix domain-containing protein [Phycisphaeraceae bacterium]|nr:helix-turn-helix domain-containing protein [Phycisphaeraceae bacterium]
MGIAGLERDAPDGGRKASIPEAKREKVIVQATRPPTCRTRWNQRTMAQHANISPASVRRIWEANAIKPHLTRTFKLSRDPNFEAKFWDVIGLCLNPPTMVLSCDEKWSTTI